jgi:hypothetical protein
VKYNSKVCEEVGVEERQEDLGEFLKRLRQRKDHHKLQKGLSTADYAISER